MRSSSTTCAFPGCKVKIHKTNVASVCNRHSHADGYCKCATCIRGKPAFVTLSKAPWEDDAKKARRMGLVE
jgi:hypothetical protein